MTSPQKPAYRKHGFTLCLIVAVLLAWLLPEPGVKGGLFRPVWTTQLGVWIIFFLQGLTLPARELAAAYKPLRLQTYVLAWNYLLFPAITAICLLLFARFIPADIALGFGLLSILPTTIASAVAFTSLARGNVSKALCATVLSNLLAIVVVPLWVAFYLATDAGVELPLVPLIAKLALLILFPVLLGQLLRLVVKSAAARASKWVRSVNNAIILFIVYTAFAGSVASGLFAALTILDLLWLGLVAAALLLLVSLAVWQSSKCLSLNEDERIAAFFCASQKSLATGLPLATAIFAVLPNAFTIDVGAVLLPLIMYHPLQLVLAAIWAKWVAEK